MGEYVSPLKWKRGKPVLKAHLRAAYRQRRDRILRPERDVRSRLIARWLCHSPWYRQAEHILTYLSIPSEVDTYDIAEMVWRDGKRLWAPKVNRAERTMAFFEIRNWDDIRPGPWGIGEPKTAGPSFLSAVSCQQRALLLVPGVAFDRRGFRIGYGGGYYDRFLHQSKDRCLSIGLTFDVQMLAWVPAEPHDRSVDGVLTERGWKKIPRPEGWRCRHEWNVETMMEC